jgi:DNA-directed RNA polymerase
VVHSFDASHLVAVVNAFGRREITTVHDAVGSHANHVGELSQIARDAFADIYREDWLAALHAAWEEQHRDLELPLLPPRGALDLEQARGAVFLMS